MVIFPNERKTFQNRTRWECIARYINVHLYGNRKYFSNGLIQMSQRGVLLWSTVEAPNTHVNKSVMPEINTFVRVITSVVVLKDKLSELVCTRNQPQLFRLGNTPPEIQNVRHLTNIVSVLARPAAPVFKRISGANTGALLLSSMSRSQKFSLLSVCNVFF